MLDKIDQAVRILANAKKDKKTLITVVGCVISFGVAVGAIAVYERLIKELDDHHGRPFFEQEQTPEYYDDELY